MFDLTTTNELTMSSLEIADLVESRHDSVKRTIERLVSSGLIVRPPTVVEQSTDSYGRKRSIETLIFSGEKGKRDSLVVVGQLSPEFMARVFDRWIELENQTTFKIPKTFSEALYLASAQAKQLEEQAPKVNHYDRVVERETLLNATQVGGKIGLSPHKLNKALDELGVYNKSVKRSRVFKQWFVDKGFGILRQTESGHTQAMFTTQGEAWVIERMYSEGVA